MQVNGSSVIGLDIQVGATFKATAGGVEYLYEKCDPAGLTGYTPPSGYIVATRLLDGLLTEIAGGYSYDVVAYQADVIGG